MATNGEILRVALLYSMPAASEAMNVFTWQISSGNPADSSVLEDFVFWATNTWGTDWADLATAATELIRVDVDVLDTAGHVVRNIGSESVSVVGTVGGETGVAAAAAYIKADTQFPKSRGSKYVPGIGEGNITDGYLTLETIGDLALLLITLVSLYNGDASGALYTPGVLRRVEEAFEEFNGAGYFTDVPAYQRRRKPNVGS